MPANGATATSSAVAGNVRFKAVAELTSMAEMRRISDWRLWGRKRTVRFRETLALKQKFPRHLLEPDLRRNPNCL